MANILTEYVNLDKKNIKGIDTSKVFVRAGNKIIPFDRLYIGGNDSRAKRVTSLSVAIKSKGKLKENVSDDKNKVVTQEIKEDPQFIIKVLDLPKYFVTSQSVTVGDVTYNEGIKRAFEVKINDNKKEYVYCKVAGEYGFYKASQIGYYENGDLSSFKSLDDVTPNDLKDKNVMIKDENKVVEAIFAEHTYTLGKPVEEEKIASDNEKILKHTFELDANGKIKSKDEELDAYYSVQKFRKEDKKAYLDTYIYDTNTNNKGEYIKVKFSGQRVETLVKKDDVYKVNSTGAVGDKVEDLKALVGQRVSVKLPDGIMQLTLPLTLEQASLTYSARQTMQETTEDADILGTNTYIKLANGKFIKEESIAHPICYDFVSKEASDADFDAYFIRLGDKTYIFEKSAFAKKKTFVHEGKYVDINQAFKIKRSKRSMKNCDVIQTSKTSKNYNTCVALKNPKYQLSGELSTEEVENADSLVNAAQSTFLEQYKKGEYTLDKVLDNEGNFVDVKSKRYKMSDHIALDDYSDNDPAYKYFKDNNITYDGKNFVGGPKYSWKSACADAYKKLGVATLYGLGFTFSVGGVLAGAFIGVTAPILLTAIPIAYAGIVAGIPIVNAIIKAVVERKNYKYKNKLNKQRKDIKKEIAKDFEFVFEETAKKDATLNKDAMLYEFENIELKILSLAKANQLAEFKMVEGKGKVNEGNAELFSQYREDLKNIKDAIKRTKDPEEKARLHDQYNRMALNYISQGVIEPKDKDMAKLLDQSNMLKGYLIKRYYEGKLSDEEKADLDTVYKDYIKDGNVMMQARDLGATALNSTDRIKTINNLIKKCRELGATEHYDYAKNVVDGPKYEGEEIAPEPIENIIEELTDENKNSVTEDLKDLINPQVTEEKEEVPILEEPIVEEKAIKPKLNGKSSEELEQEKHAKLMKIYKDRGIDKLNKNGTLRKNETNLTALRDAMVRCIELAEIRPSKLTPEDKKEYNELKLFIRENQNIVINVINNRGKGEPKYITSEFYDSIASAHWDLASALKKNGVIVNAKGEFLTNEDLSIETQKSIEAREKEENHTL